MKDISDYFRTLYNLERVDIKYDLKHITALLKHLGNPHKNIKFIHIAGTNGKGATASFLASILMEHGLKTGLYTSPHLFKFNERIQVNGHFIADNYIKSFIDANLKFLIKIKASFFETTTSMAFKYLFDNKVDIAVIEVGLGGRLDTTNVIDSEICIITQIGIDHTQYLGKTLKSIAKEKIGIVKKSKNVVISDIHKELVPLFNKSLKNKNVFYIDKYVKPISINEKRNRISFKLNSIINNYLSPTEYHIPLNGAHQVRNACTALLASKLYLDLINKKYSVRKSRNGLNNVIKNTFYHGRFEFIKHKNKKYIFDAAHNPDAIKSTVEHLKNIKIDAVVFAIMNDKDYITALNNLVNLNTSVIFTQPKYQRARDPKDLYEYYIKIPSVNKNKVFLKSNLNDSLKLARGFSTNKGNILVLGSFFLVSEAMRILGLQK